MTQRRFLAPAVAAAALLAASAALYLAAPDGRAADKNDPKAAVSSLDFVPGDAVAVASIRVADLLNRPAAKAVVTALLSEFRPSAAPSPDAAIRKGIGVGPDEIERATLIGFSPQRPDEVVVAVTTLKPYDHKSVLAAAAPEAKEEKVKDRTIYDNPFGSSLYFLDDRTYLFGPTHQLAAYLEHAGAGKEGPLTAALTAADKHLVVLAVDAAAFAKTAPPPAEFPPEAKPLLPLLKGQLFTLTVDLDGELRADARLTFANEVDAKEGVAAADAALEQIRGAFAQGVKQFTRELEVPKLTAILEDAQTALKTAKAEQKGAAVEAVASMKIDSEAVTAAMTEDVPKVIKQAARRMQIINDLKQLVLAMHNYHDQYGRLPAAAIYDKNGKPLLSWRVALLPYIEQAPLYKEFHLDESWDSDHNKPLLEKMPTTFGPPDTEAFKNHETFFQVFVGKGSVFDGKSGIPLTAITDGTSNTLAIVDAAKPVPWTKPEDIPFDERKLLPRVGGLSKGGFFAALCDGSVRYFPEKLKEETLRAVVTPNGGEDVFSELYK